MLRLSNFIFSSTNFYSLPADNFDKEKELLFQISEGNETAFRDIFHLYGDIVHANIFSIIKSPTIAKDLVQDTFLRVWLYRDKLPEIENFRVWLLRISYNRAFSYLSAITAEGKRTERYAEKYGVRELRNTTDETMQFIFLNNIIKKAVHDLPPQQKKVYQLSREHGLKNPEIAEKLKLSVNTIKNTLGRALQSLRDAVEKSGFALLMICYLGQQ